MDLPDELTVRVCDVDARVWISGADTALRDRMCGPGRANGGTSGWKSQTGEMTVGSPFAAGQSDADVLAR